MYMDHILSVFVTTVHNKVKQTVLCQQKIKSRTILAVKNVMSLILSSVKLWIRFLEKRLPWQGLTGQGLVSIDGPWQEPMRCWFWLVHNLLRYWVPFPHEVEHLDHSLQTFCMALTINLDRFSKFYKIISLLCAFLRLSVCTYIT